MNTESRRLLSRVLLIAAAPAAVLGVTLYAWQSARTQERATAAARLEFRAGLLRDDIRGALVGWEGVLGSVAALLAASEVVEPREWESFLGELDIERRFPAVREVVWAEGEGIVARKAYPGGPGPRGFDDAIAALLSLAPDAAVAQAVGGGGGEAPWSMLLCVPVRGREARWMVGVFDIPEMLGRLVESQARELGVRVRGEEGGEGAFASGPSGLPLSHEVELEFGGERWSVALAGSPALLIDGRAAGPILAGGLAGSGVVALVIALLLRSQRHALASRRSEQRLQSALDSVGDFAILLLDRRGRITQCSAGVRHVFGYAPGEVQGSHFARFHPPLAAPPAEGETAAAPEQELEAAARDGRTEEEGWRVRKDGSRFWTNTVLSALRDEDGRLSGFVKIARDMTERRRAQEQLAQSLRELARSNSELQQFAYIASHDLQEPLRAISSYLQLIQRRYQGQLDAKGDQFITFAVEGATRMKQLINDLLEYSRAGTRSISVAPTSAEAVLAQALQELRIAIAESGARVTHGPLPTLPADPGQFRQLFLNLVGNAIKFRDAGRAPEIHITAERREGAEGAEGAKGAEGGWVFSVRDNGIGIAPEYAERIFEIFQRLHTRDRYPGTGIGLAVCKRIVERHHGRIWVEPSPGVGSTFRFFIPAAPAPAQGAAHAA